MSKKRNYEIEVPFFCGYYESPLLSSDTLYCEVHYNLEDYQEQYDDPELTEDDLDMDFGQYKDDVNRQFIESFNCEIGNAMPNLIESIEFSAMTSPKYYNYATDRLFANIVLCEDWQERILAFMKDKREWLTERIEKDWTSYDGFWSHMHNTYDEWIEEMSADEPDWLYLSVMLGYIIYDNNNEVREDLIMDVLENVWVGSYIVNLKESEAV